MSDTLDNAKLAFFSGHRQDAAEIIRRLICEGNSDAMFFAAQAEIGMEAEAQTNIERLYLLNMSAELNNRDALYELYLVFETGDGVPEDKHTAKEYLQRAAIADHPHALWQIGLKYLYGTNGFDKDINKGREYIERSAELKSQGALRCLAKFYSEGTCGYSVDIERARNYSQLSEADDVLQL